MRMSARRIDVTGTFRRWSRSLLGTSPVGSVVGRLLAALIVIGAVRAQAQPVLRLPERVSCPRCVIELIPEVQLGDTAGDGIIEDDNARAWRDSGGRFLVVGAYGTVIKVFGPDGRFQGLIGRKGGGPGEFGGIGTLMIDAHDSVHVFDHTNHRYSVFSPSHAYVRSIALPIGPQIHALRTRSFLAINLGIHTPDRIGLPVHVLDLTGRILASTGSRSEVYRPDITGVDLRALALANGDTIWSAHIAQYAIDLIDLRQGRIVQTLTRSVDWFPPRGPLPPSGTDAMRPQPGIRVIRQDSAGRLWVLIGVPDPDWMRSITSRSADGTHFRVSNDHEYRDAYIEVIDPKVRRVVASRRWDKNVFHFVSADRVSTFETTPDGEPRLQIWRIELRNP